MPGLVRWLPGLDICTPAASRDWPQYTLARHLRSSCPDLIRASTSFSPASKGVDGRVKPGHDDLGLLNCCISTTNFAKPDSRGSNPAMTSLLSHVIRLISDKPFLAGERRCHALTRKVGQCQTRGQAEYPETFSWWRSPQRRCGEGRIYA